MLKSKGCFLLYTAKQSHYSSGTTAKLNVCVCVCVCVPAALLIKGRSITAAQLDQTSAGCESNSFIWGIVGQFRTSLFHPLSFFPSIPFLPSLSFLSCFNLNHRTLDYALRNASIRAWISVHTHTHTNCTHTHTHTYWLLSIKSNVYGFIILILNLNLPYL